VSYPEKDKAVSEFEQAMHDCLMEMPERDAFKKAKANMLDAIWEDIEYSVIDRMSETIAGFVRNMANRVVEEILEGREGQMKRYLKLDGYIGRHEENPAFGPKRDISEAHPVIHGSLHENSCIAIRRKMAQAHADLIQNERIKDLEDQVASLVAQVNKKDAKIEALRERINY
jgi:hypothetical protein